MKKSKLTTASLNPGPGFRIRKNIDRPDKELVQKFREFPTPDISDLLNRLYAINAKIHLLTDQHHHIVGTACTITTFPGDNLMVHKSLDIAEPDDILVIAAGGSASNNAVLGDLIANKAKHRGFQGCIIDGLIRDLPSIKEANFPVFARGTTPIGPLHRGPGEINYPIACGGVVVNPGDIVAADAAGIVVIPKELASELIERLTINKAKNQDYYESVKKGIFSNAWVDDLLENTGCSFDED